MKLLGSASELTSYQICYYDFFRRKQVCYGFAPPKPKFPHYGGGGKDCLS
jgi:hypothetical protein